MISFRKAPTEVPEYPPANEVIAPLLEGVEGWCTRHKAEKLYELALLPSVRRAVEIGVFGGKSLLPVALAFSLRKEGRIYGIEPWDNQVAVETPTSAENDKWWAEIDLLRVKRSFFDKLKERGLDEYACVIEMPSDSAVAAFRTPRFYRQIDLVHVDGVHSVEQSMSDVVSWLAVLRPGGFLVLDDTNWETVTDARRYLAQVAAETYSAYSDDTGHFSIFQKRI